MSCIRLELATRLLAAGGSFTAMAWKDWFCLSTFSSSSMSLGSWKLTPSLKRLLIWPMSATIFRCSASASVQSASLKETQY